MARSISDQICAMRLCSEDARSGDPRCGRRKLTRVRWFHCCGMPDRINDGVLVEFSDTMLIAEGKWLNGGCSGCPSSVMALSPFFSYIVMTDVVSLPFGFGCVSHPRKLFTDGVGCLVRLELPLCRVVDVPLRGG
ncbi:hypothetical protein L484_009245 [Morus notabilis]|uniref:Uncharacterized protein n=1 Tax=Morus notabilis TaxID=981085 RepID=W9SEE2_9ROSA|nr:hypothetical protein L484_009245 [Morus notabilis]